MTPNSKNLLIFCTIRNIYPCQKTGTTGLQSFLQPKFPPVKLVPLLIPTPPVCPKDMAISALILSQQPHTATPDTTTQSLSSMTLPQHCTVCLSVCLSVCPSVNKRKMFPGRYVLHLLDCLCLFSHLY